jgi:hypothetical protein
VSVYDKAFCKLGRGGKSLILAILVELKNAKLPENRNATMRLF